MKLLLHSAILLLLITGCASTAQERVKGNRDVTTEYNDVEPFTSILISNDVEVELVQGSETRVEVMTDSNLHQYIEARTSLEGVLTVTVNARVRSSKEMKIKIMCNTRLNRVTLKENARLEVNGGLELDMLKLEAMDDAQVEFKARVKQLEVRAHRSTRLDLDLDGDVATIDLKENAGLKGKLNYDKTALTLMNRTDVELEGSVNSGSIHMKDRAQYRGKGLTWDNLKLVLSNNAQAAVNVKDDFVLDSTDDGEVTVYNNPKFTIARFEKESVMKKD